MKRDFDMHEFAAQTGTMRPPSPPSSQSRTTFPLQVPRLSRFAFITKFKFGQFSMRFDSSHVLTSGDLPKGPSTALSENKNGNTCTIVRCRKCNRYQSFRNDTDVIGGPGADRNGGTFFSLKDVQDRPCSKLSNRAVLSIMYC